MHGVFLVKCWRRGLPEAPKVTWENRAPKNGQVAFVPRWCRVSPIVWVVSSDYGSHPVELEGFLLPKKTWFHHDFALSTNLEKLWVSLISKESKSCSCCASFFRSKWPWMETFRKDMSCLALQGLQVCSNYSPILPTVPDIYVRRQQQYAAKRSLAFFFTFYLKPSVEPWGPENPWFLRGNKPYFGGFTTLIFHALGSKGKPPIRASFGSCLNLQAVASRILRGFWNGLWDKAGSPSTVISWINNESSLRCVTLMQYIYIYLYICVCKFLFIYHHYSQKHLLYIHLYI